MTSYRCEECKIWMPSWWSHCRRCIGTYRIKIQPINIEEAVRVMQRGLEGFYSEPFRVFPPRVETPEFSWRGKPYFMAVTNG